MRHPAAIQATQQYQLRVSKLTLDVYGWDKQIKNTSLCLYSYSSRGTELAGTESLLPSQTETGLNWTNLKVCVAPFYIIIKFTSAVWQWHHEMTSQLSASSFGAEKAFAHVQ